MEGSRRRLDLDQLDGLMLHSPSVSALLDPGIHDFMGELLHSGRARFVGASVKTLPEVEAALSIPNLTMLQVPVGVAAELPGTPGRVIRARKIAVFVREILHGVRLGVTTPREAISTAIAPDFVTAVIVGLSTRRHLDESLAAFA